jgi:thiosulfate/3-mercaptopyruvate sulfurtransferase
MSQRYTTLIEAAQLRALIDEPDLVLIDCRHSLADTSLGERQYRAGHIPGARFLHLDRDLSGTMTGANGRHPLPHPDAMRLRFGQLGIGPGAQVIAYDEGNSMVSVRVWWLLNWLGHPEVAVLNGGLATWTAAGLPLTADAPADPMPRSWKHRLSLPTVDAGQVLSRLGSPGLTLIDARSAERFRGENETIDPVAGHIPESLNRPYLDNLGPDFRFKSAKKLRAEFLAVLDGRNADRVVHLCGSGVSAAHNILAMRIAGFAGGETLYPGSWSEWCSDPARPVATGAG